ncbi:MAG: WYL domain-containing protein [Actinomycetota bacterium]|nr:WYL domain-containing protein [Actinomycetota bacterium]
MPGDDTMEPLERLLNLVGLLLETPTPLTFEQIRDTLEGYQGDNIESVKRKFERDKDMLRAYGVPLEMTATDAWDVEQGYIIRKERYYLPEIPFTPEEITALYLAAQSGSETTDAAQGIRKLLYGAEGGLLTGAAGGPLAVGSDADPGRLLAAAEAASKRRSLRFGYRTATGSASERTVDAYGVVFRSGRWYLVGHDHERDAIRAFRLSRASTELVDVGGGTEPPDGFRAIDHVEAGPWNDTGLPVARVAFGPAAAVLAGSSIPGAARADVRDDGSVVLTLPATDLATLAPLILGFGPDAEVLEPASLRNEIVRRLTETLGA